MVLRVSVLVIALVVTAGAGWLYFVRLPFEMCSESAGFWDQEDRACFFSAADCRGLEGELAVDDPGGFFRCKIDAASLRRTFELRRKVTVTDSTD